MIRKSSKTEISTNNNQTFKGDGPNGWEEEQILKSDASLSYYWSTPYFLNLVHDTQYTPLIFNTWSTITILFHLKITDENFTQS
jgi:hypothetical protein